MDLLRVVIIGPAGTPYHDGLFFFDVYFPPAYPHVPPVYILFFPSVVLFYLKF
jgi:ubiquitin-conjugating enzyme E2 O